MSLVSTTGESLERPMSERRRLADVSGPSIQDMSMINPRHLGVECKSCPSTTSGFNLLQVDVDERDAFARRGAGWARASD